MAALRRFFSQLTLGWLSPLLRVGSKRPLELDDIPTLRSPLRAGPAVSLLRDAWERQTSSTTTTSASPSLLRALWSVYWKRYMIVVVLQFIFCGAIVTSPVFVDRLLRHREAEDSVGLAYADAVCLWLCFVVVSCCVTHSYRLLTGMGCQARTALMALVFEQGLRLPLAASAEAAHLNLMAVDTQRVWLVFQTAHIVIAAPIIVVVGE